MRKPCLVLLGIMIIAAVCSAAQREGNPPAAPEHLIGIWSGTWEGAGSGGGLELAFTREKEGPIAGRVSVTGEPAYTATLKTLSFEGKKMTTKYDFTPDDAAEVTLAGSFEGSAASGTWSLREKSSGNEVASGSWKVARK